VQILNKDLKVLPDEVASEKYDSLHEKYADHVRDVTYRMRGFYLKHVSAYTSAAYK
jgi:hypothetical protein